MKTKSIISAVLIALTAVACGGSEGHDHSGEGAGDDHGSSAITVLEISAEDFHFGVDGSHAHEGSSVPAGLVQIDFVNNGKEPHMVQLLQIDEGLTYEEAKKEIVGDKDGTGTFSVSTPVGGAGGLAGVPPGETLTVFNELEPGTYALACFVDGHVSKGMLQPFEVTPAEGEAAALVPPASETIGLSDFSIDLPEGFTGSGRYEFVNNGPSEHEATLYRFDASLKELERLDPGRPPPGGKPVPAGGVSGIPAGASAFADLDLEPGTYAFICFFPDEDGKAHFEHGMFEAFEV